MTLTEAKEELDKFVRLKTTMRPTFADVLMSDDVQEVVRCRECRYRDAEKGFCEGRGWPMQLVPDDGFCDKGERRKNG